MTTAPATLDAPAPVVAEAVSNLAVAPTPLTEPVALAPEAESDRVEVLPASVPNAPAPNAPAPNGPPAPRATEAVQTAAPAVQIADAIVTHASTVERGGATEFRMRLDPPELGPVRVRLIASGDSIHGQVVVSDDAIRRMIESQLPELRQRLEAAGVTVQTFDVTTDAGTGGGRNAYRADAPADLTRINAAPGAGPRPSGPRAASVVDVTV